MNGVRFRCDALANAWGAWTEIGAHSVARTYRIVATAEKGAAKIEGIVRYGGQRQAAAASFADSIAIRTGRFAGKLEVCFRSLTIATTVIGTVTMADE